MVLLILVLEPPQNRYCVIYRRLFHLDLLEPALERSIFFDVFPILIECRSTNALKLAATQGRLDNIRGIHRALR